jgi:hypothetical protein
MPTEVQRLARRWASQPDLTPSAFSWLHLTQVTEAVQEELRVRLDARDPMAIAALRTGKWDWLMGSGFVLDPVERPLSVWLSSRILGGASLEQRVRVIRQVAPLVPGWAAEVFLERDAGRADADEVVAWMEANRSFSPGLANLVERLVQDSLHGTGGRARPLRRLAPALRAFGTDRLTPVLRGFLADHDRIVADLRAAEQQTTAQRNAGLRAIAKSAPPWLRLFADELAELLLSVSDETGIAAVSGAAQGALDDALERAVARLAQLPDDRALVGGLWLIEVDANGLGRPARRALARIWDDPEQASVRDQLVALLPSHLEPFLQEFEASLGKGNLTRAVARGARRMFNGKERR